MKDFVRGDLQFSLCGLKCCLCPMKLDGYCPGCGGGAGNQTCAIARCSLDHGGPAYCVQCPDNPCGRYEGIDEYDSFVTHQCRKNDLERLGWAGPEVFHQELADRERILRRLLAHYNDGRKKTLFSLAANLLDLEELAAAMERIEAEAGPAMAEKERAALAACVLKDGALRQGVELKLKKKPAKKRQ